MSKVSSFQTALLAAVVCVLLFVLAKSMAQTPVLCPASLGTWETRAPIPLLVTELSAASIQDKVYALGGIFSSGGSSNRLFIYDAAMDRWTEGAPLPITEGVNHANLVAADFDNSNGEGAGELYLLGALLADGTATGRSFRYNPTNNAWREIAALPTPRGAAGIAAGASEIFVAGGANAAGSVNTLEAYDPRANTWARLPEMPTPRDHLTAQRICIAPDPRSASPLACLQDMFVAFAGRRNGVLIPATEAYNLNGGRAWISKALIPTPRAGLGSFAHGTNAYVIGGEGSTTPTGTFQENEYYDAVANGWCRAAPMPTPRHGFYAAVLAGLDEDPGPVYTVAGGPQAGAFFSQVNEVFFPPAVAQPTIGSGGVVNAANYEREIAGGSIVSLFGQNLTYRPLVQPRLPLPTQLNGTSVLVNGTPAPLLYTSPRQINFIVPASTTSPATIRVRKGGADSQQAETIQVLGAAPGIFSADGTGSGQGAILHAGTGQLANAARPARAGDALEIYLTGLLDCPPGQACIQVAPDVTIGGVPAPLLFYGRAPGFAGLNQINVRVPQGVTASATAPVVVSHAGRASNQVTIAVQ